MTTRKSVKREREAIAEPTTDAQEQASVRQYVAEDARARMWEMHLRGIPKARIADALGVNRATVARLINAAYAEIAAERKRSNARKLDGAVGRMRRLQEQAWADHDADDERELQVLALSMSQASDVPDASDASDAKSRHSSPSNVTVRYQSQRSQYLRIILDAEKEIARLEGLYEGMLDVDGAVGFVVIRRDQSDTSNGQGGSLPSSATLAAIQPPSSDAGGGEA